MLSTVTRSSRKLTTSSIIIRSLATESVSASNNTDLPPILPKKQPRHRSLYPRPRTAAEYTPIPHLPASFGRNQLLSVSNSTRALLESIVDQFDAPIRYAFAYGSGVFEQDGYASGKLNGPDAPMLDFIFAVTHPGHFHSINLHQHPSHYPLHARLLGSDFIASVQDLGPGVWFNTYVPMSGVTIKYGVTTVDNLCSDLLNWRTLYLAGRMHKPLRIIKDDARVRLTQQVNLASAARLALLTLPASFSEKQLFERIGGISYNGDLRMVLPGENRSKVENIVKRQGDLFTELYRRLVSGLPGVHWGNGIIEQDVSVATKEKHLRKLPEHLVEGVRKRYITEEGEEDEEYWKRLAADEKMSDVLQHEIRSIVWRPAAVQTIKGLVSAGPVKSERYISAKVSKWWRGN